MISILTKSDDARLLAKFDAIEIADRWRDSLGIDVGENFRRLGHIDYVECGVTGFRYYMPPEAAGGVNYMRNSKNSIGIT